MKRLILIALLLLLPVSVEAQRIRKHGGLIDINSSGDVIVTPRSGRGTTAHGKFNTCLDAGANDTYACSLTPAIASYVTGQAVYFKANTANTGAATLNLNALGAKTIKKVAGGITTDLATNDIRAGQYVALLYDGTNFQMLSAIGNSDVGGTVTSVSGTANQIDVATGTTTPVLSLSATAVVPGTLGVTGALSGTSGTFSTTLGVTGVTTTTGGLSVGAGNATLLRLATGTASLDFTALAASTCETFTIPVTNSTTGSSVSLGLPDALADVDGATESTLFTAWVSANGTVSVRRCNVTAVVTADPDAATVRATVLVF